MIHTTRQKRPDRVKIKVFQDGNKVCVLWGVNLQVGVCGFGDYISEAFDKFIEDFLKSFDKLENNFSKEEIVGMYDFLQWQFESTDVWQDFYKNNQKWQEHQDIYYKLKTNDPI